jgi:hypothetical protein
MALAWKNEKYQEKLSGWSLSWLRFELHTFQIQVRSITTVLLIDKYTNNNILSSNQSAYELQIYILHKQDTVVIKNIYKPAEFI